LTKISKCDTLDVFPRKRAESASVQRLYMIIKLVFAVILTMSTLIVTLLQNILW